MIKPLRKRIFSYKKIQRFTRFYREFIHAGDLCFDIGANVGERTTIFLKLGAKVVAVEPVEESFLSLKRSFGKNQDVSLLPCAIGEAEGEGLIHIANHAEVCTLSKTFIEKYKNQPQYNLAWNETRTTPIKTLDELIASYGLPQFCKIDVEGYEPQVLRGLSQPIPWMSFEYNNRLRDFALNCLEILAPFKQATFNFSPYESMSFMCNEWKNHSDFYHFVQSLSDDILTGDIYVRNGF